MLRTSARILLVDPEDRVLLFQGNDPAEVEWVFWFTVGGGVESGESLHTAALRELAEETGIVGDATALVGPVWRRRAAFRFNGEPCTAEEWFFLYRVNAEQRAALGSAVDTSGWNDLERNTIRQHHWWSVDELAATGDVVYPARFAEALAELLRDGPPVVLREVD